MRRAIPKPLWLKARSKAVGEGKTIKAWIIEAIEAKLKEEGEK